MLGLAGRAPVPWFAAGKHPCAADFFTVGKSFALAASLSRWVDQGYLGNAKNQPEQPVSWRFWAGIGELVAFGVLLSSRDRVGRRYPLLLAGHEMARGWQRRWEAVPAALLKAWQAMEGAAAGSYPDVAALEARLASLSRGTFPVLGSLPESAAAQEPGAAERLGRVAAALERERGLVSVPLDPEECGAEMSLAGMHAALKQKVAGAPSAVFAGGAPEGSIHFFYRPLASTDFAMIWRDGRERGDGAT